MATAAGASSIVLIAGAGAHSLAGVLEGDSCAVVPVHTGTLALEWARDGRPDLVILEADLPDMSGIDACRLLQSELGIGHHVPVIIVTRHTPTPDQRVSAVRAGVWDFLRYATGAAELSLKLQTYVHAKRNMDVAFADGLFDPTWGLHSRPGLARRARELGALMARTHGALACVVFALETDRPNCKAASLLSRSARLSDVVGALGPCELAVLAPSTDHAGAAKLAQRVGAALREAIGRGGVPARRARVWVGYDAMANATRSPIDPVELLPRAAAAVRHGVPEPDDPWVRRFEVRTARAPDGVAAPSAARSATEADNEGTSP